MEGGGWWLDGVEGWMAPNCARQISAMLPPNFSHVSGRLQGPVSSQQQEVSLSIIK